MTTVLHSDVIQLAAFDDDPQPLPHPALAEARPTDRPRPDPATHPSTDPVSIVLLESDSEPSSPAHNSSPVSPTLAFDILLWDPKVASFLVIYSAGTPLCALKPRTVSIPAMEADSPITSLAIHTRSITDSQPVPYRTFRFSYDVRGKRLTLRFADPANSSSLIIEQDSCQGENGLRDGLRKDGTQSIQDVRSHAERGNEREI
jgi:hypothetical protein